MLTPVKVKSDNTNVARICVPICVSKSSELRNAIDRARSMADFIELRLDCLEEGELDRVAQILDALFSKYKHNFILTFRSTAQGGKGVLTELKRHTFWLKYLAPDNHSGSFADIELDSAILFRDWERAGKLELDWSRVICSHHDFEDVPDDIETIYEQMAETPAAVLKIAVQAREVTDCLPIFKILKRAKSEHRPLIPIAMGAAGIPTRVLGPSRGAFLTFGALDKDNATAPGQVTAEELCSLYRIHSINEQTEIFGLVSSPVAQSVSPHVYNAAFAALGINAVYLPLEVHNLKEFLRRMVRSHTFEIDWNLRGLSIANPYRSEIIGELDWIDESAREIGRVNQVTIKNNKLLGFYNDGQTARRETSGGLKILVAQAAKEFRLWTGKTPPLEVMENAARRALKEQTTISSRKLIKDEQFSTPYQKRK
ncbi:MAG TPA: type I 3-dehydroquinate dehydratase [Pyrinomonadaceae bacterium]|nr:type I 3-dehydroquinate dehydratase [Pyrinomonadaceae bacterium]